jgi:hypothetical protein
MIEVVLDLRRYGGPADSPEDVQALWSRVEGALAGRPVRDYPAIDSEAGEIGVHVVSSAAATWSADSPVAIAGVLQRLYPGRRCAACAEAAPPRVTFAPFECRCEACRKGQARKLCEAHALIPRGRDVAFAPEHAPRCPACGAGASFWCDGGCDEAFCDAHGRGHPTSPDHTYDPRCFELCFPACSAAPCGNLGAFRCEHVLPAGDAVCGSWVCPLHGVRWQVYGPEEAGLGRCPAHADIPGLPPAEILRQIFHATVLRQTRDGGRPSPRPYLPKLRALNYIFRNAGQTSPSYQQLHDACASFAAQPAHSAVGELVQRRLQEHLVTVGKELARLIDGTTAVRERLRQVLAAHGMDEIAQALEITDYKPASGLASWKLPEHASGLAFWKLPEHLRRRFIGKGGETVKALGERTGVMLKEDDRRRR